MHVEPLMEWELTGKLKYSEIIRPNATLSITNPISLDLGSKLGRRGWKQAINHLSYNTATLL
jgi:hypothetical protein